MKETTLLVLACILSLQGCSNKSSIQQTTATIGSKEVHLNTDMPVTEYLVKTSSEHKLKVGDTIKHTYKVNGSMGEDYSAKSNNESMLKKSEEISESLCPEENMIGCGVENTVSFKAVATGCTKVIVKKATKVS